MKQKLQASVSGSLGRDGFTPLEVNNTKQNEVMPKAGRLLTGFTLIELLVVIAIIALLTSIALISLVSARQKARNSKRLSDITQMASVLELYFSTNKGFPNAADGLPIGLTPTFTAVLPTSPIPPDGVCEGVINPSTGQPANTYYYQAQGDSFVNDDGITVYGDYNYYFCLGNQTGSFAPGIYKLTRSGIQ